MHAYQWCTLSLILSDAFCITGPTLKLKRNVAAKKHADKINAMYSGSKEQ